MKRIKFLLITMIFVTMFSTAAFAFTCIHGGEYDDKLDGNSSDKPDYLTEFGFREGYGDDGIYSMKKYWIPREIQGTSALLYVPKYTTTKEGYLGILADEDYRQVSGHDILVFDEIDLGSPEDPPITHWDRLVCNLGNIFSSSQSPSIFSTGYPKYSCIVDNLVGISVDEFMQLTRDDLFKNLGSSNTSDIVYPGFKTFTESFKHDNMKSMTYDYICTWKREGITDLKGSKFFDELGYFTGAKTIADIGLSDSNCARLFIAMLSSGEIDKVSDEILAKIGVYRASKYQYDHLSGNIVPKLEVNISSLEVPHNVKLVFNDDTNKFELTYTQGKWADERSSATTEISLFANGIAKFEIDVFDDNGNFIDAAGDFAFDSLFTKLECSLFPYLKDAIEFKGLQLMNFKKIVTDTEYKFNYVNINSKVMEKFDFPYFLSHPMYSVNYSSISVWLRNVWKDELNGLQKQSNWVKVTYNVPSNTYSVEEYGGGASFDDIRQSEMGGNNNTTGDIGNADNVQKVEGGEYDGTEIDIDHSDPNAPIIGDDANISLSGQDTKGVLNFISTGFGMLGDNGIVQFMSQVFGFIPKEIWTIIVTFVSISCVVALFKIIF